MVHGNLKNNLLKDIIDEKICYLSKDFISECKACEYRYVCNDCRPDSYKKDIHAKPWYCTYDPCEGQWLEIEEVYKNLAEQYSKLE